MDIKHVTTFVLLDVALVVIAARLGGKLFRRMGQPAVIGEIVAGIALGPTLLGAFPGDLDQVLFPLDARPVLSVIAQLGLALFMFIVGLELDLSLIRGRQRAAGTVAAGAMLLPLVLGGSLALLLYPTHTQAAGRTVPMSAFVLFLGVAMAITALPVLARILTERGMQRTPIGVLALACAAIDDVLGWSLLALVIAIVAGGSPGGVFLIIGLTLLFVAVMFLLVRPLLARLAARHRAAGRLTPDVLAIVLAGLFLSAWATDAIGVHAIFGAFVFGAVMPRKDAGELTRAILERIEQVSLLLLLPMFFVVSGLQVDVGGIGLDGLWQLPLVLLVAVVGKFFGASLAARALKMPQRHQETLGLLMNTRGLTELVILQVGVQLGVLDGSMFTLMVIMALVTTMMTGPLLRRVYPDRIVARELAAAEGSALGAPGAFTVLAVLPESGDGLQTAMLAARLTGHERPARVVLCRLLPAQPELEIASGLGVELAMIASVGDRMRVLARELEAGGTACSVVARFAADPGAELAALVTTTAADVVLLVGDPAELPAPEPGDPPRTADLVKGLGQRVEAAVVVADRVTTFATGTSAIAYVDGGPGERAAVRVAAHLALHGDVDLAVAAVDGRVKRVATAVAALERRGVRARPADDDVDTAPGAVVVPADTEPAPLVPPGAVLLRVHPAAADVDDDLDQAVARVAVSSAGR